MPLSHPDSVQTFLDYLSFQKRYSPHTITSYQNDLSSFFDFIQAEYGDTSLKEINPMLVRSWLAALKRGGMESRSINRKISALKSFFKFHLKSGQVGISPMTAIVSPKNKKRLPQYVDEKGMGLLFRHIEFPEGWQGKTERLILELLYNLGIRQAELTGLKESQIDSSNNQVKVTGKGNKERILPVSRELMKELQVYIAAKAANLESFDSQYVLVMANGKKLYPKYIYNVVRKYLALVTTIEKKSPHVLRHTFATHLMNNGAEINAVKELLGHSSLAATQVYTHNTIEKLKDIHKKAHPKA